MIKALQRRFVAAAMIAITGLILLMLGAINTANLVTTSQRLDRTLELLCDTGGMPPAQKPSPEGGPFPFGGREGRREGNDISMSSSFFVVRFGSGGEPVFVDVSRAYNVTEDEAVELARNAAARGEARGEYGMYRYLVREWPGHGTASVFLDASGEGRSFWRVLFLSAGVGLGCWGIMLAFVMLLSKRAIRPIAENIERQKQFVTNAGHEIKTPLAIIQSNAEALELYTGESKWSRNIKEQTARLGGLVKDLLLLARMDEGAVRAEPACFSLSELVGHSIEEFSQPMEARKLALKADIPPDVAVNADREQIRQLVSILLDNAVKYSAEDGGIAVTIEKNDRQVKLHVQNTCAELPQAPPDKLFDRFYRADAARTQKSGGYGIGLSVAKSLAAANRAGISAKYIQPDTVCFTVRFRQ